MDDKQKILDIEYGFWKAAGDKQGDKYYIDNFDDSGILLLPFEGGMLNKESVLSVIPKSIQWKSYEFRNVTYVNIADGCIELCYEVEASHGDDLFHGYVSSVYVYRDDSGWKLISHQQTKL